MGLVDGLTINTVIPRFAVETEDIFRVRSASLISILMPLAFKIFIAPLYWSRTAWTTWSSVRYFKGLSGNFVAQHELKKAAAKSSLIKLFMIRKPGEQVRQYRNIISKKYYNVLGFSVIRFE
jgi:hypothetical protein